MSVETVLTEVEVRFDIHLTFNLSNLDLLFYTNGAIKRLF